MPKITESTIKALKPKAPATGNILKWDGELNGFGVRITAGGVISFVLSYRNARGERRRYTIGRCSEWSVAAARDEAIRLKQELRKGIDPLEPQAAPNAETFAQLAQDYVENWLPRKRASSQRNDRQMIQVILLPRLGDKELKTITRADVETIHNVMRATPYRANRVVSLLCKMFNRAIADHKLTENPAHKIERFDEPKRERWLKEAELSRLDKALDAYPNQNAADAIRLLILTGSRAGEVLKADWKYFDMQRGIWTKPSHHTKTRTMEHVPLSQATLALLRKLKPRTQGPLFTGADTGRARVTLRRPWVQVLKAAGLAEAVKVKGKRRHELIRYKPTVRMHDLRHTYASHLVSKGVSLQIVGKLVGHTNPATTNRYAHVADEALRDATNIMGGIVNSGRKAVIVN